MKGFNNVTQGQPASAAPESQTAHRPGGSLWTRVALTAAIFVLTIAAQMAYGQNSNSGDIRGTITDSSGAVVPGATITFLETDTGVVKTIMSDKAGVYDAISILPGHYKVTVNKDGFKTYVRSGILLMAGAITINVPLQVGSTSEEVSVTADNTRLQTDTAEQSATLPFESMIELPNVGQTWGNFIQGTLPGVNGGPGAGMSVTINGTMPYDANVLSDGGTVTVPVSLDYPSNTLETIAEVKVDTANFSAEYGTGSAIVNQITKSGTNTFHGAAYTYLQNNVFNSGTYFSHAVPMQRWTNWGASLGGPIVHKKAFFYINYNRIHDNYESFPFYTYPTTAMRNGDFSDTSVFPIIYDPATYNPITGQRQPFSGNMIPASRIDSIAKALLNYFPQPNLPGTFNNWQKGLTGSSPYTSTTGRLDYDINSKNRLSMTNTNTWLGVISPTPDCPLDCENGSVPGNVAQITDVWTLSPSMVNEFRLAFVRYDSYYTPPTEGKGYPDKIGMQYAEANIFPNIGIAGSVGFGGTSIGSGPAAKYNENTFSPSDVVTLVRGKHIIKLGGEYLINEANDTPWSNVNAGNFTFNGYYTEQAQYSSGGMAWADFLLGQIQNWSATNSPLIGMRSKTPQLFAQDDIKLSRNLTLNLGLRYEHQGPWSEVLNRIGDFDPSIMNPITNTPGAMWFAGQDGRKALQNGANIWLPRVGFSYSPKAGMAIRGGFGRYAYGWSQDAYAMYALGYGANSSGSLTDNSGINPVFEMDNPNPPLNYVQASRSSGAYNGQWVPYYPVDTPVAIINQVTLSIQQQLPSSILAELAYVGSYGSNLPFITDINVVPASQLGPNGWQHVAFPQYGGIYGMTYNNKSNYSSFQASLKKDLKNGLAFNVNYTWSHMLDDEDTSGWAAIFYNEIYQDGLNPNANYGPSSYDLTNMFKTSVIYQLPFGTGRRWLNKPSILSAVFGGWQGSAIFNAQSGFPYTVTVGGTNLSGTQSNGEWYPNVTGNPRLKNPSIQEWFNTNAFAVPAAYTLGDEHRNSLRGPGLWVTHLSAAKNVPFTFFEHTMNMQLRIDAFNAFNHTAFGNPDASIGTPGAGVISSTQVSGRTVQIGGRFSF